MLKRNTIVTVIGLVGCAGLAQAQTVNGKLDPSEKAFYGPPRWIQENGTGFGNAGVPTPCDPNSTGGDPALATTGVEIAIPLSAIGNPAGAIKICAFINGGGHDYLSNQVLGSLPAGTGNLGGDGAGNFVGGTTPVAGINFGSFAGDQFATATPTVSVTAPTVDGTLDAAIYGAPLAVQAARTGFGNSNNSASNANGSELDAVYAVVNAGVLYVCITGNVESNFNKFDLFIDSVTGGQQTLLNTNPNVDFDGLNKMAGLTFDAGFEADYYLTFGNGNATPELFANFADFAGGIGNYLGSVLVGSGSGVLAGGTNPDSIQVALNNTNAIGVDGLCPPPAGNADVSNGSEFDAIYAKVDTGTGKLWIMLTGNIENSTASQCDSGGNKIQLFVDAIGVEGPIGAETAAGQNKLRGDNVDIGFNILNGMGDDGSGNGLHFDEVIGGSVQDYVRNSFLPDYWMSVKTSGTPNVYQVMDAATLRSNGRLEDLNNNALDFGAYDGRQKDEPTRTPVDFSGAFSTCNGGSTNFIQPQDGFTPALYTNYSPRLASASLEIDPFNPVGTAGQIMFYLDNSNIGGITDTDTSLATSVTTGLEIAIDLDELGWDGSSVIKIGGFIVNNDGSYMSNQVIGGLPAATPNLGNVGATRTIDLNTLAGRQYVFAAVCLADVDDGTGTGTPDGGVTIDDLLYYLNIFNLGDATADVDDGTGSGAPDFGVTIDDLLYYLARFNSGC
ncbi:MAG: hypothetical protein IPK69_12730 [Phycisphaerales bacterium]|nr:MAG: hypothetical protein IPK69_12730 [Phycisphaerales bacterium]